MNTFEDYFWPGTTVLANKLGITDASDLRFAEYRLAGERQEEIVRGDVQIPRTFDAAHVSAVHSHLFGDVYEWAGQWRSVDMEKAGVAFASVPREVSAQLMDAAGVASTTDWGSVDREGFVAGVAQFYAHLNYAHPFREGNGRAGKLVVDQLAEQAPFAVKWDAVSTAWWNIASKESILPALSQRRPDPASLVRVFEAMTVDRVPAAAPDGPGNDPELTQLFADRAAALQSFPRSIHQEIAGAAQRPTVGQESATPPRSVQRDQGYER